MFSLSIGNNILLKTLFGRNFTPWVLLWWGTGWPMVGLFRSCWEVITGAVVGLWWDWGGGVVSEGYCGAVLDMWWLCYLGRIDIDLEPGTAYQQPKYPVKNGHTQSDAKTLR